jgi:hypothetical protein
MKDAGDEVDPADVGERPFMQVTILIILATWVVGSVAFFGLLGLVDRDARLPRRSARLSRSTEFARPTDLGFASGRRRAAFPSTSAGQDTENAQHH